MRKIAVGAAMTLALLTASKAEATYICAPSAPAGYQACASVFVTYDGSNLLTIRVTNEDLWAIAQGFNPAGHGYGITGIGIVYPTVGGTNINMSVAAQGGAQVVGSPATGWTKVVDGNISGLFVELGADANGQHGNIVGCNGAFGSNYFRTCAGNPPATTGSVLFSFTGVTSFDINAAQGFAMRAQGGAWSYRCTDQPNATNARPCDTPNTPFETVPEPITMVLLGSGLVGVGAAARRRRREDAGEQS